WTSTFSNLSALVVPLSSTVLPSRDSFPNHPWFAPDVTPVVTTCSAIRLPSFEIGSDSCRGGAPCCSMVAHQLRRRTESSHILRVKLAQSPACRWIQCQRFPLPRSGRAARSKARREQIIGDGEPPPGSRGELGS